MVKASCEVDIGQGMLVVCPASTFSFCTQADVGQSTKFAILLLGFVFMYRQV